MTDSPEPKPAPRKAKGLNLPVVEAPVSAPPVAAAAPAAASSSKEPSMMNENVAKPFEAVAARIEQAPEEAMAQARAGYEQMNERMREVMEKSMHSMSEMSELAKGNIEAMIASAKAASTGAESMTAQVVETMRKQMEETQTAMRAMTSAKSPNEFMQLQNEYARAQFDRAVANWSQMSETMLKLAGEVVQPLSNRMAVAAETVKKSIA